jgi:polysaccharide deacetylase 2 family uncharacterized protein YibQ
MAPAGKGRKGRSGNLIIGLLLLAFGTWWLLRQPAPEPIQRGAQPAPQPTAVPEAVTLAAAVSAATAVPPAGPRLALVVDDWGYQARPIEELPKMGFPLTAAVLPNLPYSAKAATTAHGLGMEVILHCPMQAQGKAKGEAGTLKPGMSHTEVQALLARHWASVPYAVGLNNHQGSLATENAALMAEVAGFVHAHNAYFLDSVTTPHSAIPKAAQAAGVPWAARRVFLDDLDEIGAIRAQVSRAEAIARKQGDCIAIGHPRANTLAVLKQMGPQLQADGIRLVFVSDLLRR